MRVAIALGESGLEWRLYTIDMRKGAHKAPEFLDLNPLGRVPVIVDDDGPEGKALALTQSAAIVLYIAEKSGRLLSKSGAIRSKELEWLMLAMTDVVAPLNLAAFMGRNPVYHIAKNFLRQRGLDLLPIIDAQLRDNQFLAGAVFSVADCAAYPIIYAIDAAEVESFANIARWILELSERPSIKTAYSADMPNVWRTISGNRT